eukprot:5157879-Prymnesium_polylepis.1
MYRTVPCAVIELAIPAGKYAWKASAAPPPSLVCAPAAVIAAQPADENGNNDAHPDAQTETVHAGTASTMDPFSRTLAATTAAVSSLAGTIAEGIDQGFGAVGLGAVPKATKGVSQA